MLKNKEERRAYLLNEDNWETIYSHPSIFTTFKQMVLPDGTIILRETVLEYDEFKTSVIEYGKSYIATKYRVIRSKYVTYPTSITLLVDLLGKIKDN